MRIEYISRSLNISVKDVRALLAELILERRIDGSIDQLSGVVEINKMDLQKETRYQALDQWSASLVNIHMNLTNTNMY